MRGPSICGDKPWVAGTWQAFFSMLNCIIFDDKSFAMRTTVTIEDALYEEALAVANPGMDKADLFREAIKTFVRVQSAKRLAALGGRAPQMSHVPRRRGGTNS